ncbi:MAG: transaldolase [Ignavibacteriae bacterium]|nr:transaldolase [Ignavibacteriota bacterium]
MTNIQKLEQLGQSIWYDNISRSMITKGELQQRVDEGLLGVTSNPTIFDKAISGSADYDDQIRSLVESKPDIDVAEIIQSLMVKDIQMACDVLRPVYDRTGSRDGYVSVEVTPSKARNTQATIEEVRLLWKLIDRRNLMVKIPATKEGLPAIEQAISEGMNINVTLIFSVDRYKEVAQAYISGLVRRAGSGLPVDHVASVASVFVSRIDTLVDDLLAKKNDPRLKSLMGKAAVANTKFVYKAFTEIFVGPRWDALKAKGATAQRPLWGSTGTKNPAYSDLLYVDTLIGAHTVNTVPPQTYSAILDHSKPALTVETDLREAQKILDDVAAAGVDMRWVLQKLEEDGVAAFERSFDGLYKNLLDKRNAFAAVAV